MTDSIDVISYIAETARETWMLRWLEWKLCGGHPNPFGEPFSTDVCIPTSFALREILHRCEPRWRWHVVGGRSTKRTPKGGIWFPDGRGGAHLWVEGRRTPHQIVTVDITADQFGGPAIVVVEGGSRFHLANATPPLLRAYRAHENATVEYWTDVLACALQVKASA